MSDQALAQKIHREQERMAPDAVNMAAAQGLGQRRLDGVELRQPGVMDEQFPTDKLTAKDARDREMNAKLQLGGEGESLGYTPFGRMEARDEDFKWYQKKLAAQEAANFQLWFAKEFDRMSPADKARAKELYPEFYQQRKQLLKKQTENLFDLARLKLEGVETYDDLMKQYLAETGRLDIGPLNSLLHPERGQYDKADQQMKFRRGLLSPFRVFGEEAVSSPDEGVRMRGVQSEEFASRKVTAASMYNERLGVDGTGFAPTGAKGNYEVMRQGDKQWYQVLSGQ